jgi:hypothetical protein
VNDDQFPVFGNVDIQFEAVSAHFHGKTESFQRIFGSVTGCATVSKY